MGDSPKWVKSKKRRKRRRRGERERLNDGDNNGQATHGERKHAWRTQAAWAKILYIYYITHRTYYIFITLHPEHIIYVLHYTQNILCIYYITHRKYYTFITLQMEDIIYLLH